VHPSERLRYDHSQLTRVYLHAWQVTGNEFFRTITEEILGYVAPEMLDPEGGFYSTQDADSEGEEGKLSVCTPPEIQDVLEDETDAFISAYSVTPHGNFEAQVPGSRGGKNILESVGVIDQRPALGEDRRRLFKAREQRVHPDRDVKLLTSWNGFMLAAFSEAAGAFYRSPGSGRWDQGMRDETCRLVAEHNADSLLRELRQGDGWLLRTWKACARGTEGAGEAKLNGHLQDYSYLVEGLRELCQTTRVALVTLAATVGRDHDRSLPGTWGRIFRHER
jgi:uncharacterized protein YyaL (SSP411 family)